MESQGNEPGEEWKTVPGSQSSESHSTHAQKKKHVSQSVSQSLFPGTVPELLCVRIEGPRFNPSLRLKEDLAGWLAGMDG